MRARRAGRRGAGAVEYGLIVGLIAIGTLYAVGRSGAGVSDLVATAGEELAAVSEVLAGTGGAGPAPREDPVAGATCKSILEAGGSTGDGVYRIDPDGDGVFVDASCDMTTDGGGWTLVLNYVRGDGRNPLLEARTAVYPVASGAGLGADESGSQANWGHVAPALLQDLEVSQTRFFCRTTSHGRTMHFKTAEESVISYFKTGTGSVDDSALRSTYTPLAGHDANLPAGANSAELDQGARAMSEYPFFANGSYHWGVRGRGDRWECDDYETSSEATRHQIWVR